MIEAISTAIDVILFSAAYVCVPLRLCELENGNHPDLSNVKIRVRNTLDFS